MRGEANTFEFRPITVFKAVLFFYYYPGIPLKRKQLSGGFFVIMK